MKRVDFLSLIKNTKEADRMVDFVEYRFKKGLSTLILVIGARGTGKSSTCYRLSELSNERLNPLREKMGLEKRDFGTLVDSEGNLIKDEEDNELEVDLNAVELVEENIEGDFERGPVPDETAVLFMQITAPGYGSSLRNIGVVAGAGVVGATVITGGKFAKWTYRAGKAATSTPQGKAITAAVGVALLAYQQGSVAVNRAVTATYCDDISIGSDARSGCSVIRTTDYKVGDILKYCSVIESIP